jgi:hypothetical protein
MQPVYNLLSKTSGRTKQGESIKKWFKIGIAGYNTDGKLCMKLDSIPVGFDGWIYLADIDEGDN